MGHWESQVQGYLLKHSCPKFWGKAGLPLCLWVWSHAFPRWQCVLRPPTTSVSPSPSLRLLLFTSNMLHWLFSEVSFPAAGAGSFRPEGKNNRRRKLIQCNSLAAVSVPSKLDSALPEPKNLMKHWDGLQVCDEEETESISSQQSCPAQALLTHPD